MNKKVFKFMGFLLPCLLIYACTEILRKPQGSESQASDFSAEEARAFFENNANALNPLNFVTDPAATRSTLENEVNLSPIWKDAVAYNTGRVSIVEIPLYSGTFMKALQKRIYQHRKVYHEYTSFDRKLIIARGKDEKVVMFLVTLLPDPNSDSGSLAEFRYLGGTRFTGLVLCSTLEGRFVEGYRYYNGHKTVRVHVMLKSEFEKTELAPEKYEKFRLYESHTVTRGGYTFYEWGGGDDGDDDNNDVCPYCGNLGMIGGCFNCGRISIPEVVVIYCSRCHQPEDECICCPSCQSYPCICDKICNTCQSYPCICDKTCEYCHSYPCTCRFCEYCGSRYCWGECQDNKGDDGGHGGEEPYIKLVNCDAVVEQNSLNCAANWGRLVTHNIQSTFLDKYLTKDTEYGMCLNYNLKTKTDSLSKVFDSNKSNTVNIQYEVGLNVRTVAMIHNHPRNNPPSFQDIFCLAKGHSETKGYLTSYYAVGKNGRIYSLQIENPDLAKKYYQSLLTTDGVLNSVKVSTYENDYRQVVASIISSAPADMDEKDLYQYAVAYLLKKYNTGITLLCLEKEVFKQRLVDKKVNDSKVSYQLINCK